MTPPVFPITQETHPINTTIRNKIATCQFIT